MVSSRFHQDFPSGSRRASAAIPSGRNIKLQISYDGTNYAGWQVQNHKGRPAKRRLPSIQVTIEKTLKKILHHRVKLIASGRTDAGVHARGQVANLHTDSRIPLANLTLALNSLLPGDIVIKNARRAQTDFHSRFSCKSKVYRYLVLNRKIPDPFLKDRAYYCPYPLDLKLMRSEARLLLGRQDLRSFMARSSSYKHSCVRNIKSIKLGRKNGIIAIEIEADGFLYNMVRNIAGTLIEIGRGRFAKGQLKRILSSRDRKSAGPTVPAGGLTLVKVKY